MSDTSDIEIKSKLPKKQKIKLVSSPSEEMFKQQDESKMTTKMMVYKALIDLKTRKGVSLYAIKKYMEANYNFDVDKNNFLIKKTIKSEVEKGLIAHTKGIGASGSFKLVNVKELPKKKVKSKKTSDKAKKSSDKSDKPKTKVDKPKKTKEKSLEKKDNKEKDTKTKTKKVKMAEKDDKTEKAEKVKPVKENVKKVKATASKLTKTMKTPSKKKIAMMKRKSIGSIIKPPKMKPKAKK